MSPRSAGALLTIAAWLCLGDDSAAHAGAKTLKRFPDVPADIARERADIPAFWLSSVEDVNRFLSRSVHRGRVVRLGSSAGGRPIRAVAYGQARSARGTTTFSGALGCASVNAYLGPDAAKRVFVAMASVHGGEFEGIVGLVNLIAVLETGKDLRGRAWPELTQTAAQLDRIIVIPVVNPDGRARIPLRMETDHGRDDQPHEYLNVGAWKDGRQIGWPEVKEFIPLDFRRTQFPGGYPNDAGVNIQHDDFLGQRQPETQALLDLAARERPDLILNLHTGVSSRDYFPRMHQPLQEPELRPTFEALYRHVHTVLAERGLQGSRDLTVEADPSRAPHGVFNLDTALNLHCGVMSVTVEFPSHGFGGTNAQGEDAKQTPDKILDEVLTVQQAAMQFLADRGGRSAWTPPRRSQP